MFWDGNYSGLLRYELYEPIKVGEVKTTKRTQPIDESELSQRRIVWNT
jgi:hypothetical protein